MLKKKIKYHKNITNFTVGKADLKLQSGSISVLDQDECFTSFAHSISDYIVYVMFIADWTPIQVNAFLKINDTDVFTQKNDTKIELLGISIKLYQYDISTKSLTSLFQIGNSYHVAHIVYDIDCKKFFLIASMHSLCNVAGRCFKYLKVSNNSTFAITKDDKPESRKISLKKSIKFINQIDDNSTETPQIETIFKNSTTKKIKTSQAEQLKEKKIKKRKLEKRYANLCEKIAHCKLLYDECVESIDTLSAQLKSTEIKIDSTSRLIFLSETIDLLTIQNEKYKAVKIEFDKLTAKKENIELYLDDMC